LITHSIVSSSYGDISDYWALLKPRVMSLVVFTAGIGMLVDGHAQHPVIAIASLLAIALGAGASGCLNMWWDADIDRIMHRTQKRPIPSGAIAPDQALAFGLSLSIASVLLLGLIANWMAAFWLAFTIFFYVVVYSMWLKRLTPQNIVIGGLAGALPPVIGQVVMSGGSVGLESAVLCALIFFWTPPHFWALSILKMEDYERAGVPMLPNVSGIRVTQHHILAYSVLLLPLGMLPYALNYIHQGFAGITYGITALVLGLVFLAMAVRVWRTTDEALLRPRCGKLFAFSIFYLFALFAVLGLEHAFWGAAL
jgi:heme o synthase